MKPARPDPPRRLGVAGRRAWRAALAGLGSDLQFTAKELDLLRLVAGQADLVDRLERQLADQPLVVPGAQGQPRPNPLIALLSSARLAQARLWSEIRLELDAAEGLPVANRRAQRAAQARWRARRELSEQRRELRGV
jgi:hypothetical protein